MSSPHRIQVRVNGQLHDAAVEPRMLLADFLREHLGLIGTKLGCEHGVCGACTVLMNERTVRSCLLFAVQVDNQEIVTVEGLAPPGQMHPLQEEFHRHHALQCGFCTSGFLMTSMELLRRNPEPTEVEVREVLSGNLCRCTGYKGIVDAVLAAARRRQESPPAPVGNPV